MSDANDIVAPKYKLTLRGGPVEINGAELDEDTARQVVEIVMGGAAPIAASTPRRSSATKRSRPKAKNGSDPKPAIRRRGSPGVVSDLSMRPSGKKSLADFVKEKDPKTHQQKQAVILYWLHNEAGMKTGVTVDHINTCYQHVGWRRPSNLPNALSVTANKKGWLDPSDRLNIKLTVAGEDLVTYELPAKKEE